MNIKKEANVTWVDRAQSKEERMQVQDGCVKGVLLFIEEQWKLFGDI